MVNRLLGKLAFWRKSDSGSLLGVYLGASHLWAYRGSAFDQQALLADIAFDAQDPARAFNELAARFGPARVQLLLDASHYQLLQADKPRVEADEVSQALLWSIKDMVSLPLANIQLDYFESPIANLSKVTVVVADRDVLSRLVQAAVLAGFELAGIGIEEVAMTHLFSAEPHARLLVSQRAGQELLLTVIKEGQLYMQRRVRGFNELHRFDAQQLSQGVADSLSLEIQRSMDYFESQLRQAPVAAIHVLIDGDAGNLVKLIAANFNQQVQGIEAVNVGAKMAELARLEALGGAAC